MTKRKSLHGKLIKFIYNFMIFDSPSRLQIRLSLSMGKPRAKRNPTFLDQICSHVAGVTRSANTSYAQFSNMHTQLISKQCKAVPTCIANDTDNNDQCPKLGRIEYLLYICMYVCMYVPLAVDNLVPVRHFRNPLQHACMYVCTYVN